MTLPTQKDMQDAVRRIALSNDGRLFYRLLQIELMSVSASADTGTLLSNHGRRSLARDLKLLMDEELAKVATERDRTGPHDPDAPAVTRRAESVSVAKPGTGRRVEPYAADPKPT